MRVGRHRSFSSLSFSSLCLQALQERREENEKDHVNPTLTSFVTSLSCAYRRVLTATAAGALKASKHNNKKDIGDSR